MYQHFYEAYMGQGKSVYAESRNMRLKKKESLPYRVFELSCTMFLHKFTHTGMEAFFCNQMNRHPSEIGIPRECDED